MAYIPPHKRHSKDPQRPSPIPERFVPQFSRQVNLKSSSKANHNLNRILNTNARNMYIVGLDADNQFPSSVHLEPTSEQRMFKNPPFVLVNSHPATKEIDEEGEGILSTPLGTISSTPWESVAVDVWPKLLSAFEIVRDMLESNDELDEVKPAMVARFGKILFHPNASVSLESLIKDRVVETTLRQMNTTFCANTPSSYMENIISGVAPKIGFVPKEYKEIFHIVLSDSTKRSNSNLYCKCRMKEDKKLELYKVEMKPVYKMIKDISCIDKNLDLRLELHTQRILNSLTDDEMHSIENIINSAVIDPEMMGGLRWPYGKACSGDRFAVVQIWHTIAKKYKSPSLSLMARHVDRFNFDNGCGEDSIEVYLKLKRLVSDLQDEKAETNLILEMFKDNLKIIWDHFLDTPIPVRPVLYANARNHSSIRSMYIVGLDADNQFPSSFHLVPTLVESFRQRRFENPLVLVNSHPATKEIDEEGEAISSTSLETISSTPWESVAVNVWPKLLSAFEIVRDILESDEVKPAIYARFGKILFHPNASVSLESLIKDRVAETTLRQMSTTFYTNTPSSYMENIISGVAPKIGFVPKEYKEIFHIVLSDDIKKCRIYCKCRMKEDKKLELYKVETIPIDVMRKNILRIDKNIDLRLALQTKRILNSLTDDERHSIRNIINSAIIDPEVKGGLRWPYGKACSGNRFDVVGIWHTTAKKYKSRSLSLMAGSVDRFDFKNAYGEASIEVNLKLKRLVSDLQEERVETDSIFEMFKDNLKMIWVHFFCCDQYFP